MHVQLAAALILNQDTVDITVMEYEIRLIKLAISCSIGGMLILERRIFIFRISEELK